MQTFRTLLANVTTFLLAIVLALVIWAAAVRASDPVETRILEINVETVGMPSQATLLTRPPRTIFITIEGPSSAIADVSPSDFVAIVGLSDVPYSETEVPINVEYLGSDDQVNIISQSPETAVVRMEQIITQNIPVSLHVRGEVARGHRIGQTRVEPDVIQVTGPAPRVNTLSEGRVTIFVDDAREDISEVRSPTFYDSEGNVVSVVGLTMDPTEVEAIIPVVQLAGFAEKPVTVNWIGEPGSGYRLLDVRAEPNSVQVTGAPDELENLRVETEPIDISGMTESDTFQATLDLPSGIGLVEVQPIIVTVEIEPIVTSDVVRRPVEVRALGEGFEAILEPDQVRVFLFGPLPILDSLAEDDVRVTVDLLNLITGTYVLEPFVSVAAEEIDVRSTQPAVITVIITGVMTSTQTVTGTETVTSTEPISSAGFLTVDASPYLLRLGAGVPLHAVIPRRFLLFDYLAILG